MKKDIILALVSLLGLSFYVAIDFIFQERSLKPKEDIQFSFKTVEVIDIRSLINVNYSDNDILETIGKWETWRYKRPEVKNKKENKENKKVYIKYKLLKRGNREIIINPLNKKESWEFYGVFIVNKRPFAIFYNKNRKEGKYKIVSVGDFLTKDLKIEKITSSKIIVKFPISEKEYDKLELNVFYIDMNQFRKKLERETKK